MTTHKVCSKRDSDSEDSEASLRAVAKRKEMKAKAQAKKEAKRKRRAEVNERIAKKAEDKAAAAEQKAQEIAKKRRVAEAQKVESKLTDIVAANKATMAQPGTLLLPAEVLEQARKKISKAEATLKICARSRKPICSLFRLHSLVAAPQAFVDPDLRPQVRLCFRHNGLAVFQVWHTRQPRL